jgi:hypothetical protein
VGAFVGDNVGNRVGRWLGFFVGAAGTRLLGFLVGLLVARASQPFAFMCFIHAFLCRVVPPCAVTASGRDATANVAAKRKAAKGRRRIGVIDERVRALP